MASGAVESNSGFDIAETLFSLVLHEGSAAHPYARATALRAGPDTTRNLADLVHYLCLLHGRLPGVIEMAAEKYGAGPAYDWLTAASADFAPERAFLTRLVVAAGPLPSTPGQAECDAAILGQHHALEMLARSDRTGCALGAALALVLDWRWLRPILDFAAGRLGVDTPALGLPDHAMTRAMIPAVTSSAGVARAIQFGAAQTLVQHRGLWDLLEAREQARRHS